MTISGIATVYANLVIAKKRTMESIKEAIRPQVIIAVCGKKILSNELTYDDAIGTTESTHEYAGICKTDEQKAALKTFIESYS